jgi:hypothetical protein
MSMGCLSSSNSEGVYTNACACWCCSSHGRAAAAGSDKTTARSSAQGGRDRMAGISTMNAVDVAADANELHTRMCTPRQVP